MIAIAARNLSLTSFISKSNVPTSPPLSTLCRSPLRTLSSILCRSPLRTLSSILCRSFVSLSTPTSDPNPPPAKRRRKRRRKKEPVFDPAVYDVLVNKHKFSPNVASFVASALTRSKSEVKCDSILTFLGESGFSSTQLEKVAKHRPRYLTAGLEEEIRSKIKAFQEWGFSPDDIAKITSGNAAILQVTLKNRIIPSMSVLKGSMGLDHDSTAELLKKCPRFLTTDLEKSLAPNVEHLKSCSVAMEDIRRLLFSWPRTLLVKPDFMKRSVEKTKEMGVPEGSKMFIYCVRAFASLSDETWEKKLQGFRDMGLSDTNIRVMFGKAPQLFLTSMKKLKELESLLVSTGKFDITCIVDHPTMVGYNIEKRMKPRLQILRILDKKKLIEEWPSIATIYSMKEPKFLDQFVTPFSKKVGKAFDKLSYLNSFICESHVSVSSSSLHTFSTILCKSVVPRSTPASKSNPPSASSESKVVADPVIYDGLVNKHKFSPEAASTVASGLTGSMAQEKSDSILTYLEESGFSSTQLETIAKRRPRLLTVNHEEKIRSKIKTLQEWGFSPSEITQLISRNPEILQVTVENRIVPSLSVLKGLLESDNKSMVELLRRCPWFVTADLVNTLLPNVEILKSCGIAMADIRRLLFSWPRSLLVKPDAMKRAVERAKEMGASEGSRMFMYAVRVSLSLSDKAWEKRLQDLRDLGFSDTEVREMFVRAPQVLTTSTKKLKKLKSVLVSTGKLDISSIVAHPGAVGCSIEKKLKPRLRILGILERKGLIEKWPSFGTIYTITDDKFLDRFVWPYSDKVGKAFDKISYIYGEES